MTTSSPKMAPLLGLRGYFSSFIAFFLVVFSVTLILNQLQSQQTRLTNEKEDQAQKQNNIPRLVDHQETIHQNQKQKQITPQSTDNLEIDLQENQENIFQAPNPENKVPSQDHPTLANNEENQNQNLNENSTKLVQNLEGNDEKSECDLSIGQWVYDNSTRPLYDGTKCKFMHDEVACDKYGRKDLRYQHWRWQPHSCDLPRFDAKIFLEKIRGKRMVFVGDSLNRNQWVSMVCLVESVVPKEQKTRTFNDSLMSFKIESYNVSIDFYWSPLLVESNCDDPIIHRVSTRIMRAYRMDKHVKNWMDADIIIFNSYLWWKKPNMKMKVLYGSFKDGDAVVKDVEMFEGFELALKSWSQWLEKNLNNTNKQMFFVSLSPTHIWGQEWGAKPDDTCYSETEPIFKDNYRSDGSDYNMMHKAEEVIAKLKTKGVKVQMVNISQLSEYRKDGHPSIYRRQYVKLSEKELANPKSYSDCTHWCLPGVPDVWNEFLYKYIVS